MLAKTKARLLHVGWLASERTKHPHLRIANARSHRLARAIQRSDVISIDVFDTALFRRVPHPVDVFEIAALRLIDEGRLSLAASEFRTVRIAAEAALRRRMWTQSQLEEITLAGIYEELAVRLPELDAQRAMALELDVERAASAPNPDVKALYDRLTRAGARVVFASDTYLPYAFVAELLASAGYGASHELFTSSALCATKEHGTLFHRMAERLGVNTSSIVHVGDNRRPDVEQARRAGVAGYWYRKRSSAPRRSGDAIGLKVIRQMEALAASEPATSDERRLFRDLGYRLAGPLFLGLTQWLTDHVREAPADVVLFCARDGVCVHGVYERLAAYESLPPSLYFEVSRRALMFPSMERLDDTSLDLLSSNHATIPVSEFFKRIGIDIAAYPDDLAAEGLEASTPVRSYPVDRKRAVQRLFKRLEPVVVERARAERPLLLEYLRDSGALSVRDVALFDIGWGGTLQYALASLLRREEAPVRLRGYYLSTDDRITRLQPDGGSALGWFTNASEPKWMHRLLQPGYWLLEVMFGAQHGTVIGYQRRADGRVEAALHEFDGDSPNARASRGVQDAALEFVDRWIALFGGRGPTIEMGEAFDRYRRFVERPTTAQAVFFGDLVHVGGLGSTTEHECIAKPPSLLQTLLEPKAALGAYRDTVWPVAYLQRVFKSNAAARAFVTTRAAVRALRVSINRMSSDLAAPGTGSRAAGSTESSAIPREAVTATP